MCSDKASRKSNARLIGKEMYEARKQGRDIPTALGVLDDDEDEIKLVKHLILHMTEYDSTQRPSSSKVLEALKELRFQVFNLNCIRVHVQ